MKKEIKIKNQVEELERVNQFVEEIGEELGLDMELQMNLNLVMEEMVSNIIFYAYPEGKPEDIELTMARNLSSYSLTTARSSTPQLKKMQTPT